MSDLIQQLVFELEGTCMSLESKCEELGLDPLCNSVTDSVDQQIFQCTECSWWCAIHEESSEWVDHDEWICRDCAIMNHGWDGEE